MIKRIRAFFTFNNKSQHMEIKKAIITKDKVFIKPIGNLKPITITPTEVDIIINSLNNINNDHFNISDAPDEFASDNYNENANMQYPKEPTVNESFTIDSFENENKCDNLNASHLPLESYVTKKKKISLSLYPDEYEMITDMISSNGFKRTEFLLACVSASKKQSFMAEYNRYTKEHKIRRLEEREAAQQAQGSQPIKSIN